MNIEQVEVNRTVAQTFDELGIPYYLCGSMASSYHGIYRSTADADFVADLSAEQIKPFVQKLQPEFYVDAETVMEAVLHESSFNLIHEISLLKVDVFIMKKLPFALEQMARRSKIEGSTDIPPLFVASAEDTILSKLDWYRLGGSISDRQWNDIQGIIKSQSETLDGNYLKKWAATLGLTNLLSRAFADAGANL